MWNVWIYETSENLVRISITLTGSSRFLDFYLLVNLYNFIRRVLLQELFARNCNFLPKLRFFDENYDFGPNLPYLSVFKGHLWYKSINRMEHKLYMEKLSHWNSYTTSPKDKCYMNVYIPLILVVYGTIFPYTTSAPFYLWLI